MKPLGTLPQNISCEVFLDTIGENIIVADTDFNIKWLNGSAVNLLSHVAPLYGLQGAEAFIGLNMDNFHSNPPYQRKIMGRLTSAHKKRINIKNKFVADIVINPIKSDEEEISGYVVLLMDVTTKAQEEDRKSKLIHQLSVPMLDIWDNIMAVPLIGDIDKERFDMILSKLLDECQNREENYVILDLSQVTELTGGLSVQINKIGSCLRLMGTECIIVGISPNLGYKMVKFEQEFNYLTFFSLKAAIKHILKKENAEIIKY